MKAIKSLILVLAFLGSSVAVFAQFTPMEAATNALRYKDFRGAMPILESILAEEPNNAEALSKIAQCYRVTYHLPEAAASYEALMPLPGVSTEDVFAYGQVLMQLGKYTEAKKRFEEYAQTNPDIGNYFAKSAQIAEETRHEDANYSVKLAPFNSAGADFCASFYKENQVVFTSTREVGDVKAKIGTPARLFIATENDKGVYGGVKLEKRAINEKDSEGPVSFTANGEKAVFARNNIKNGTSPLPNGGMKQDIFTGNLQGQGQWDTPKAIEANGTEYSVAYPFITANGKEIYFASDMPGGIGGFDIYKIENLNGKWTAPVNLGEGVNTTGDEITPFLEGDVLFFSSNWYEGYGGFDVFETNLANPNSTINNLGTAINSAGDDFGFIYDKTKNAGFLTSNRTGGKGMEDIYTIVRENNTEPIVEASTPPKQIEESSNPIGDLVNSGSETAKDLKKIQVEKVAEYSTPTKQKMTVGHVLDLATNDPVEDVVVTLVNKSDNTAGDIVVKTDKNGQYSLPLSPYTNYIVNYSKASYVDDARTVRTGEKVFMDALAYSRLRPAAFNPNVKLLPSEAPKVEKKVGAVAPKTPEEGITTDITPEKQGVAGVENAIEETKPSVVKNVVENTVENAVQNAEQQKTEAINNAETTKTTTQEAINGLANTSGNTGANKNEVFEIHVANSKTELSSDQEAVLRKHGSLYKNENDGIFSYKLGYYDNAACATTTRDKIRELGFPSAAVAAKQVDAKENVSKMRLSLGRQKASCPSERPTEGKSATDAAPKATAEPTKEQAAEYKAKTVTKVKAAPKVYTTDPEEGEVRDADPTAGTNNDGFVYYLQLGSFEPSKKVPFKKIGALKIGTITHTPNKNGKEVYMLGVFETLAECYNARQKVIETGEVTDPFVRTYDKNGAIVNQ